MKLRHISLTGGFILSAVIFTGHLLFSNYVIQNGFSELERQHVRAVLETALHQIRDQQSRLDAFAWDWASWDDTYRFVLDADRQYVESNLPDSFFTDQHLSALIIRRGDGVAAFAKTITPDGTESAALLARLLQGTRGELPPLTGGAGGRGGILYLDGDFHLVVQRPILTSEGQGPATGDLIMARRISREMIETMGLNIGAPVRMRLSDADIHPAREPIGGTIRTSDDSVSGAAVLPTLGGRWAVVSVTLDRGMTRYGHTVATYNNVIIALAMLLLCAGAYLLLHFKLFQRLEGLDAQVAAIRGGQPNPGAVQVSGDDELSALADSINGLLGEIARSHREQMDQAEAIANNERFLSQVLNSLSVGILLIDPDTRVVVSVNDHALRLAGRDRDEVEGNICDWLADPGEEGDRPIPDRHQPHALSKRELPTRSGGTIPIMKSVSYVDKNGQPLLLETIVDITEIEQSRMELEKIRQGLEEMVAARTRELAEANRELVALDKARTLFLSSASHELRTPLTSILGFLKLMEKRFAKTFLPRLAKDERLRPQAEQFSGNLAVVLSEAERLGRLVNDLLDLNKIDSGRMEWRDATLDMHALLQRAAGAFAGEAADRNRVRFVIDPPPEGMRILADADRIQQVLINLLNNAFKFTDEGEVRLSVARVGDSAEFRVSDTGRGIPEEDQEQIFELFYQVWDKSEQASHKLGTGMGLAICRQIITHYGGVITVESRVGVGSTFRFTLPLAGPEAI
ncbi:MAG: ATP-binding protein [Pseudodesulfovibrio sp.]